MSGSDYTWPLKTAIEVKRLISDGYQPSEFDDLGKTPLHYAAERGHLAVMKTLLSAGADVNAHDERVIGNTPLREVAANCSYEIAKILIDAGADPTIPGWMQITALHQARANANERKACRSGNCWKTRLHVWARLGHNNSLDRSGGSVFRIKPGAAKIE